MSDTPAVAIDAHPERDEIRERIAAAYEHGRADENEACAQLAEQHYVRYQQRAPCSCGRTMRNGEPCSYEFGPPQPFADLIRARTTRYCPIHCDGAS